MDVVTLHVDVGIYCGLIINGPSANQIVVTGAGSVRSNGPSSTTLATCAPQIGAVLANNANVLIGSLTLAGGAGSKYDYAANQLSLIGLNDDDVEFATAGTALLYVKGQSFFSSPNFQYGLHFTGGAAYGIWISTNSTVVSGVNVTNTVENNPNFSGAFLSGIDGAFYNQGTGSHWVGAATGMRYSLALNSRVDTEQNATPLPGSKPGYVASGSKYYTNAGSFCIGGTAGCPIATAPTNLGSGGFITIFNSSDHVGLVILRPGAGAAYLGTFHINIASILGGANDEGGVCGAGASSASSAWANGSKFESYYSAGGGNSDLQIAWNNNGVPLTAEQGYDIWYICE